jgi:hypothetical protein
MAFEIMCGQCGGRLLVERAGVVVACPMCEAHLSVPETNDAAPTTFVPTTNAAATMLATPATHSPDFLTGVDAAGESPTVIASASPVAEAVTNPTEFLTGADPVSDTPTMIANPSPSASDPAAIVLGGEPSEGPTEWISHSSPRMDEFVVPDEELEEASDLFDQPDELPNFAAPDPNEATQELSADSFNEATTNLPDQFAPSGSPPVPEPPTIVLPSSQVPEPATERIEASPLVAAAPRAATATTTSSPSIPQPHRHDTVPRYWFIVAAGYASAVTLVLLLLLSGVFGRRPHPLESLPDLVPPTDKSGNIGMKKVTPELDVAPGHSQRFGNVRVTPVKVTRSPIRFEHAFAPAPHSKNKKPVTRTPTEPVLKLALKFENVSADQEFAPLDSTLIYKRIFESQSGEVFALNFVGPEADRKSGGELHRHYDLPEFSEYVLVGQNLGHTLKPGETWETYVPSEEGLTQIDGEWVWRVLLRKGYHPQSKRGVTTLIDVHFDGSDVIDES